MLLETVRGDVPWRCKTCQLLPYMLPSYIMWNVLYSQYVSGRKHWKDNESNQAGQNKLGYSIAGQNSSIKQKYIKIVTLVYPIMVIIRFKGHLLIIHPIAEPKWRKEIQVNITIIQLMLMFFGFQGLVVPIQTWLLVFIVISHLNIPSRQVLLLDV